MKYKITRRLTGYFSVVLLLFSFITGLLFFALSTKHSEKIHEQNLRERAVSIAKTLTEFQEGTHPGFGMGKGRGYGAYLRFIDEIAMSDVWLVNEDAQTIQMGQMGSSLSYEELPEGAENLIQDVFAGNVETNQEFSSVLGVPTITVGAPVCDSSGNITAALLLHSPVNGIDQAKKDSLVILLFCISAALILTILLAYLLARRFILPLQKMGSATERIRKGIYTQPTGVEQDDEIGILAHDIDELSVRLFETEQQRKELEKMRQDFISNISHELRTPVTVIKGSLEVLEEGMITNPQEIQEYYHEMLTDITQLERLVNDLLELSRLQNVSFQIEKIKLNLTEVLMEAVHSIKRLAALKQVEVLFDGKPNPCLFYGDYGRLRQMFTIVLDNAVKFSPPNETVLVFLQKLEQGYQLSITDHGCGIAKEDLPYIFDRFYTDQSGQNKDGSGLGLSIAKQIANRHRIDIHCESVKGGGTCFLFDIHFTNS